MGRSLNKIGIAKAHCGGKNYTTIGAVFRDEEDKLVIKIDTLPLAMSGWAGWINVFDGEGKTPPPQTSRPVVAAPRQRGLTDLGDDIPF